MTNDFDRDGREDRGAEASSRQRRTAVKRLMVVLGLYFSLVIVVLVCAVVVGTPAASPEPASSEADSERFAGTEPTPSREEFQVPVAEVPVAEVPVAEVSAAEVPAAEVPVAEVPVAEVPAEVERLVATVSRDPDGPQTIKKLHGHPGETRIIEDAHGSTTMSIAFVDAANRTSGVGPVGADGAITLPPRAGLYRVELRDPAASRVWYGMATVNGAGGSFAATSDVVKLRTSAWRYWSETAFAIGDFDEDGRLDLAFGEGNDTDFSRPTIAGGVYVFTCEDKPVRYRERGVIEPETRPIVGVQVGDFNEDGHLDVAYLMFDTGVRICLGDGRGGFVVQPVRKLDIGPSPQLFGLEVADLDRDGHLDLVVVGGEQPEGARAVGGVIAIFRGDGRGGFAAGEYARAPGCGAPFVNVAIADADDDGRLDLFIVGCRPAALYRVLQQTDGSYSLATEGVTHRVDRLPPEGDQFDKVTPGYLNDDGLADAIVIHTDGPSTAFLSRPGSDALVRVGLPTCTDQHGAQCTIADLDGDGQNEIYLPLKNRALFADRAGTLRATLAELARGAAPGPENTILGAMPMSWWSHNSARFADVDGDGLIDLVQPIAQQAVIELLLGRQGTDLDQVRERALDAPVDPRIHQTPNL